METWENSVKYGTFMIETVIFMTTHAKLYFSCNPVQMVAAANVTMAVPTERNLFERDNAIFKNRLTLNNLKNNHILIN